MSAWQYFAAIDGFIAANSPSGGHTLSEEEKDAMWARLEGE